MNLNEYISSGILETYVLGELNADERREVELNLSKYPELRQELALVERTLEGMSTRAGVQPPGRVKETLMQSIAKSDAPGNVVSIVRPSGWRYATAASIALALIASALAYYYYDKWQTTALALDNLIVQNQQIAKDYNVVNDQLDKIAEELKVINNPAFSRVVMKGTESEPEAIASVYWNPDTEEVYLSVQYLKEIAEANQFQLWAIVDGKPVDAGVFDNTDDGLFEMKPVAGATAFAITIEPRGGSAIPTLELMQVIGALPKG